MNVKLVPYTFKIHEEVKDNLQEIADELGFSNIAQLLRAVLYRLATGRLTIEFHPDEGKIDSDSSQDSQYT